jgi:TolB-like protein
MGAGEAPSAAAASESVDVVGLPPRTVAVLPFQNLSADPANAFLGLGVAEIVLNRLAGSEALVVIARSSSFAFEGRNVDAREIGRQLGARYLVQGGVQRAGDRLRVTSQLVDAQTGRQLRALTFDRAVADLFDVQDEIANQMAAALDVPGVARPRDTNVIDAHLAYLQGLEAAARYRVAEFETAIGHFARARSLDPRYAGAYAAEALARIRLARLRNAGAPVVGAADQATIASLVDRALELDPNSSAAYVARGSLEGRDAADAERDLRRAIALEPSNGEAYFELAQRLGPLPQRASRQAELLELLERAILLDPLQPRPRYVYALERQGEGMEALERNLLEVLRVDPDYVQALNRLGQLQAVYRGEYARALELIERSIAADPRNDYPRRVAASVYLDVGDLAAALDVAAPLQDSQTVGVEAALRRGDVEEAGRRTRALLDASSARWPWAALATSSGNYGPYPFVAAIVEEGLRAGETGRALRLLREFDSPQNSPGGPGAIWRISFELGIARLERAAGGARSADRRAQDVLRLMDSGTVPAAVPRARAVYRSLALASLRRDDEAIRVLGEAQRAAPVFASWIALEQDSTFDTLRGDPRFQAIAAEARRHAAQQRALVEEMRRSGRIARRPATPGAP